MLPEILGLFLGMALGFGETDHLARKLDAAMDFPAWNRALRGSLSPPVTFKSAERAVTNWRIEAAANLDLPAVSLARFLGEASGTNVPRCVKLNNYWCVKRAGWAAEIASDAEGHVAFSTALEGATVAAMLLKRYYLEYHLRSAQAIISRWAPAQCGLMASAASRPMVTSKPIAKRAANVKTVSRALAPLGIGNTLRARWLSGHRPGLAGFKAAGGFSRSVITNHPSVITNHPSVVMMKAPEIAVGMGEANSEHVLEHASHPRPLEPFAPLKLASLGLLSEPLPLSNSATSCALESQRIHNYAVRASDGLAASLDADLHLFEPDGTPTPNLPHMLENMAKVEIGPLAARKNLIEAGVRQAIRQAQAKLPQPVR
jgi:hypothetical protein